VVGANPGLSIEQQYTLGVQLYLKALESTLPPFIHVFAVNLVRRIQQRTPVLTRRLQNSFHVVPPNTSSDTFSYADDRGHTFSGGLQGSTGPFEAMVGTNVPYGWLIESGSSRKAPTGMVGVSVGEVRQRWLDNIRTIVESTWKGIP